MVRQRIEFSTELAGSRLRWPDLPIPEATNCLSKGAIAETAPRTNAPPPGVVEVLVWAVLMVLVLACALTMTQWMATTWSSWINTSGVLWKTTSWPSSITNQITMLNLTMPEYLGLLFIDNLSNSTIAKRLA